MLRFIKSLFLSILFMGLVACQSSNNREMSYAPLEVANRTLTIQVNELGPAGNNVITSLQSELTSTRAAFSLSGNPQIVSQGYFTYQRFDDSEGMLVYTVDLMPNVDRLMYRYHLVYTAPNRGNFDAKVFQRNGKTWKFLKDQQGTFMLSQPHA